MEKTTLMSRLDIRERDILLQALARLSESGDVSKETRRNAATLMFHTMSASNIIIETEKEGEY